MNIILNDLQIDALKEMANIGAGNAATSLSRMINKTIDMEVPKVEIIPFQEVINKIGNEEDIVVAMLLKVIGDVEGNILFIINSDRAQKLMNIILEQYPDYTDEIVKSVYQEIGNILGASYIGALSQLTGLKLGISVPAVSIDMLASVLVISFMDAEQYDDYILSIDTKLKEVAAEANVQGNFFFIPKPGSLEKILSKLGL